MSSLFLKFFALLAMMLVGVNGAWAQESSTSDIYKFRGVKAERIYAYGMNYNKTTHHQNGTFELGSGVGETISRVLFDVTDSKGLKRIDASTCTFTNNDPISKYGNFVIRTSQITGKQTHYRLKFHYGTGKTRHLDIYRHEEPEWGKVGDKNDGLVVISLQTPALFQSDAEVNSIHKIEIECMNYENRGFKVEACYFITMMPDFDYNDIDGHDIGNAYIHPSFLIPSNGVNIYPAGEENDAPDYDNYIIEVEATTNYFVNDDPNQPIDWHKAHSEGQKDSLSYTNPKLVWSMNYATPQNMNDVTYCTVDRWGDNASASHFNGNALWRWIFVHRELFNVASGASTTKTDLTLTGFNVYDSPNDGANIVDMSCTKAIQANVKVAYGQSGAVRKGINLNSTPYNTYKYLVIRKNIFSSKPYFGFNVKKDGVWNNSFWVGDGQNVDYYEESGDYCVVKLESIRSAYPDGLIFFSAENNGGDLNIADIFFSNGSTEHQNVSSNLKYDAEYWHGDIEDKAYWGTANSYNANGNPDWRGTIYGNGVNISASSTNYADLSNYGQLIIYTKENGACPRVFINGTCYDNLGTNSSKYIITLADYKDAQGHVYLNAIKQQDPAVAIKAIELVKYWTTAQYFEDRKLETSDFKLYDDSCNDLDIQLAVKRSSVTTDQKIIYGADNTYQYIDLSDYDNLIVTASEMPLFLINKDGGNALLCHPIYGGSEYYTKVDNVTYNINLGAIKAHYGYAHLNGILNWFEKDITGVTMKLEKVDPDQASNYTLNDKDAIHFYNSVYNGDFTNTPYGCHGDDHATRDQINYIYYQTYGNEYNQIMCDAASVPANRMPVKDGDKTIGYYANVTADGYLVSKSDIKNIKLSIKDICLTKNKVQVQQNHANVIDLFKNKGAQDRQTFMGQESPASMNTNDCADITDYNTLYIKGGANEEIRLYFNASANDDAHRILRKIRLDANGYAELNLDGLRDEDLVKNNDNKIFLCSVKSSAYGVDGTLDYLRAVKDKDEKANGVHVLTREDFHTWNGAVNATVTRRDANGNDFDTTDGFFRWDSNGCNNAQNYAELTGWKWMKLEGTPGTNICISFNAQKESNTDETNTAKWLSLDSNGELWFNVADYQYFHLHNISRNGDTGNLTAVKLIPDPRVDYVLRGNGTLSVEAANAMMDKSACVIDARPRVNNKRTIDLYTEEVYRGGAGQAVYDIANDKSYINAMDGNSGGSTNNHYVRMGNPNCLVMMRADFNSKDKNIIVYDDIYGSAQYQHGIRLMRHANNLTIPNDYGEEGSKVVTAGLFLVDRFPYRIPLDFYIVSGNTASYARYINDQEKPLVNTICLPFPVTLCSNSGDDALVTHNSAQNRYNLNDPATLTNWYKITDLVHNTKKKPITTAGLLYQDDMREDEYVFLYEPVSTLDAYTPYVFVNGQNKDTHNTADRNNMTIREGGRIEVYSGWPDQAHTQPMLKIEATVNEAGIINKAMDNSAHKTDINGDRSQKIIDDYYLYGTNAPIHDHDNCWYFNKNGYLVKADYMTNNAFRAVLKSKTRKFANGFEDIPQSLVKVINLDSWLDANDETAVETISDPESEAVVAVYNVNGILVRPAVKLGEALEGLPRGIYIVDGKKAIKR